MTILFLGTGEIGVPTLRWLIERSGHHVIGVVCQPDKPVGRRQHLTAPAPKSVALEAGIPVFQPDRLNDRAALEALLALHPDLILVIAHGQFVPKRLREAAALGCLNLHASLLPRWRGASPIQSAIAAGDTHTGVTVMHVDREMDAGDTILAETTPIDPEETGQSLHDRLASLAPRALARALPLVESGTAPRFPQDPAKVTHCLKLSRDHARLDWSRPAVELECLIRAYHPWPGTHTCLPAEFGTKMLKIFPPTRVTPWPPPDSTPPTPLPSPGTLVAVNRESLAVATAD
ncbi:MAG: methionyl-tRNA formyltransferase, partial [Verrucomicrobiales bacterium]